MSKLRRALPDLLRGILFCSGVILFSYGAWLAWQPAGFMAAGLLLLVGILLEARGHQ